MSQKSFERESFRDRHKIFYVTYGQKLTILHPLEVEIRGKNSLSLVSKHAYTRRFDTKN